ncbi:MAG TPA: hypothetical protein VI146_07505 [Nitrososphaeraceae archaeon]
MVFIELVSVNSNILFVYLGLELMMDRTSAETSAATGERSK